MFAKNRILDSARQISRHQLTPLAVLAVLLFLAATAGAQARPRGTLLKGSASCATCRLVLLPVATISDTRISFSALEVFVASARASGFIIGNSFGEVARYSAAGSFRSYLGQRGRGPREFLRPFFAALGPADSVFIADREARRIAVFGAQGRPARSLPIGNLFELLLLPDSRIVYSGVGHDPKSGTHSLHLHASNGQHIRSNGVPSTAAHRPNLVTTARLLAPTLDGSFLAATVRRYTIELWDTGLNLREVIVREVQWFPALADDAPFDLPNRKPMPSTLIGLLGSAQSPTVYPVIRKGAAKFVADKKLDGATGELGASQYPTGAALNRYVDTIVEAIDIPSRTVLATNTLKGGYFPVLGSVTSTGTPLLWRYAESSDGSDQIEIFALRLVR